MLTCQSPLRRLRFPPQQAVVRRGQAVAQGPAQQRLAHGLATKGRRPVPARLSAPRQHRLAQEARRLGRAPALGGQSYRTPHRGGVLARGLLARAQAAAALVLLTAGQRVPAAALRAERPLVLRGAPPRDEPAPESDGEHALAQLGHDRLRGEALPPQRPSPARALAPGLQRDQSEAAQVSAAPLRGDDQHVLPRVRAALAQGLQRGLCLRSVLCGLFMQGLISGLPRSLEV
mmetsp:Transcript_131296/g.318947  ORF Transcript_131296/g.318947 Transcript_131296/m.318947 type:complete len:232 (-) Transcript_131296:503-1198(-)